MAPKINYKARAKTVAIARSKRFAIDNKGTAELRRFIRTFEKFPADLRKRMRPMLIATGADALARAKINASWSSRIPGSLRVSTSFTKRSAGVTMTSNRKKAPHARPYEGMGRSKKFKAPTGTPAEPFVFHRTRPFFFSAADSHMARDIDKKIGAVVALVATEHGFK